MSRLRVFYGWSRTGKIRKRPGISVIYENVLGVADHHRMNRSLKSAQDTVCWRYQTAGEAEDAKLCNRVFLEYMVFMDDKRVQGSLEAALKVNDLADSKNVSSSERKRIADALRESYMRAHPDYKEPVRQLFFDFEI